MGARARQDEGMRGLGWCVIAVGCALGCGSGTRSSGAGGAGGAAPASMAGAGSAPAPQVEAAVSAKYRWRECGRIEASAPPISAGYASDGSILVLEKTGRLRLFPEGSSTATTLLPGAGSRDGFWLTGDGLSLASYEGGTRVWYAAADRQPISAATSELVPIDPVEAVTPPPNATAESCADSVFVTDTGTVMTASSTIVCFWESLTGPLLARVARPTAAGRLRGSSAFSNDGFFTLENDELIHVDLNGEVVARTDLSGLIEPSSERNWQTSFITNARTLVLAFTRGAEKGPRFVALDTLSGNVLWEVTLDDQPQLTPSFMFDPDDSVLLVERGPILRVADGAVVGHDVAALPGRIVALTPGAHRQLRLGEQVAEWDLDQQRLRYLYGSHSSGGRIYDIDVTPDGRHFASHGNWAVAWQVASDFSQSLPLFHGAAPDESWYAAIDPSGSVMAVSGDNVTFSRSAGTVGGWPAAGTTGAGCTSSASWAFSPTGPWAAGSHYSSSIHVYDTRTLELVTTLPTSNCGGAVAFSPDGSKLVTASLELFETEQWTRLWDPPPGSTLASGYVQAESGVVFSRDGQELTSSLCPLHNQGCRVTRHRATDGSRIADVPELEGDRVRYSPEGHWLVSKGQLFHLPTGATLSYAQDVEVAAFTPEGDLIAGALDGSIARYCRAASETP
jgi:hypothetical protein